MNRRSSTIASINLAISAVFVFAAIGWPYIQKGVNWRYRREARAFFEKIEKSENNYKLINNKYLPFGIRNNSDQLKKLQLDLKSVKYFDFAVAEKDDRTFYIIAQLKPDIIKRWYLNGTEAKLRLTYEKRDGQEGRLVDTMKME